MKKPIHILFTVFSAVLLLLFAVITLFYGARYEWLTINPFWTIWLMTVIPVLVSNAICLFVLVKNSDAEFFVSLPLMIASSVFEIVSLAIGSRLTFLLSVFHAEVTPTMWLIELIVMIVYGAILFYLIFGTNYITKNRKQIKAKVFYIRNLASQLDIAMSTVEDQQLKKALTELRDDIRYSDPMSKKFVEEIEQVIRETVEGIVMKISSGAGYEDCKLQIQKCKTLIMQRNEMIRNNR